MAVAGHSSAVRAPAGRAAATACAPTFSPTRRTVPPVATPAPRGGPAAADGVPSRAAGTAAIPAGRVWMERANITDATRRTAPASTGSIASTAVASRSPRTCRAVVAGAGAIVWARSRAATIPSARWTISPATTLWTARRTRSARPIRLATIAGTASSRVSGQPARRALQELR